MTREEETQRLGCDVWTMSAQVWEVHEPMEVVDESVMGL